MKRCWIALGGNLGDVSASFRGALEDLGSTPHTRVNAVSSEFETAPVGSHAGSPYRNAAAELETSLEPLLLLDLLQSIEQRWGRVREKVWGPRTLDLDLLLIEGRTVHEPRLQVPHPHLWYRRFVLDPLVEIAPQAWHPDAQLTIRELHSRLLRRPFPCRLVFHGNSTGLQGFTDRIVLEFPEVQFVTSNEVLAFRCMESDREDHPEKPLGKFQIDLSHVADPLETAIQTLHAALGR